MNEIDILSELNKISKMMSDDHMLFAAGSKLHLVDTNHEKNPKYCYRIIGSVSINCDGGDPNVIRFGDERYLAFLDNPTVLYPSGYEEQSDE